MTKVDPGTPPASVAKRQAMVEAVLNDEDVSSIASAYVSSESEDISVAAPISRKPTAPSVRTEKVTLEHELYTLTFGAIDVSVSDHQLAITVPTSADFKFEPKVNSAFIVKHLGNTFPVVYLGGVFHFKSSNTWAITFLIDKQQTLDDQELSD